MKKSLKIFFTFLVFSFKSSAFSSVHAQIINPTAPYFAKEEGLALLIATLWKTAFMIGGIITLLYFVLGGLTWVTAGGDKANSEKAKSMITDAVIGLVVLAGSFALIKFIDSILGTDILNPSFPINN